MATRQVEPISGVRAIITGGASGLGFATAEAIVREGGYAALLDIDDEMGEQAKDQWGDHVFFRHTDVTSEQAVDEAVAGAVKAFGEINVAVNCAGIASSQRVLGREGLMPMEAFSRVIHINLIGTFLVCRAAANVMQNNKQRSESQRGVIINTASIAAFEGQIGQAAYAASKGGIASLTLPLAREFARIGVRVVTIAPGLFKTPLFDTLPKKAVDDLVQSIPFPHRLGRPEEFAALVCHIWQNPMINGEVIRLDGALRM